MHKTICMTYQKLIKHLICFAFTLSTLYTKAQVAILQNTINKLDSCENFSYRSTNKKKEIFVADTATDIYNALFVKKTTPGKEFGYLFKVQTADEQGKPIQTELYNGQNFLRLNNRDSSYEVQHIGEFNAQNTLPGFLQWLRGRLERPTTKVIAHKDTLVDGTICYHITANVFDSLINKERNYTLTDVYINKSSGLPSLTIVRSRNTTYGNGVSTFYSESSYADYKLNQKNIDTAAFSIPKNYHLAEVPSTPTASPLTPGTMAPNWTLYDTEGKKVSLTELKGKVVLLDFFFIGCGPCMSSLKPLENLYNKYKRRGIVFASISHRDNAKQLKAFKKNYNIKYPIYGNAAQVAEDYHTSAFPTYYFINKKGEIANIVKGYDDNFEKKMTAVIESLL